MDILKRIERMLDLPEAEKTQVMRELKAHYEEIREELIASGMEPDTADQEAARRLGDPEAIASNLTTVHCVAPWKSALMAIVPPLCASLVIASFYSRGIWACLIAGIAALMGVVFTVGAIKGFRSGGRPVWLPVWTAASVTVIFGALNSASYALARQYHTTYAYLMVMSVGFPVIAVLLLCWRMPSWKRVSIWILAGGVVSSILATVLMGFIPFGTSEQLGFLFSKLFSVTVTAAWVLLALRVFALHRYGSAAQAALFIFSMRAISGLGNLFYPLMSFTHTQTTVTSFMWYSTVVTYVGLPLAVLAFARANSFALKISLLGSTLVLIGVLKAAAISQMISQSQSMGQAHSKYAMAPVSTALYDLFFGLAAIAAVVVYHNIHRRTEDARYAV